MKGKSNFYPPWNRNKKLKKHISFINNKKSNKKNNFS